MNIMDNIDLENICIVISRYNRVNTCTTAYTNHVNNLNTTFINTSI